MSCMNQYEREGYRSFGDNIPTSCQGAYFPGDEPGTACKLTGELCRNLDGKNPEGCDGLKETEIYCPYCAMEGAANYIEIDGHSGYFCHECHSTWQNLADFNDDANCVMEDIAATIRDFKRDNDLNEKIIASKDFQIKLLKERLAKIAGMASELPGIDPANG